MPNQHFWDKCAGSAERRRNGCNVWGAYCSTSSLSVRGSSFEFGLLLEKVYVHVMKTSSLS